MGQAFTALALTVGDPCCEQEDGNYVAHVGVKSRSDAVATNVGDVYSITLTKTGNTKLGLDLDFVPTREAMPVRAITGFLAEEWNQEHPENQVLPGDRIVEVNGTHGVAEQMMKVLKESEEVRITFVRLKKAKGTDDWEYVRTYQDRLEFEENMPTTIYELVPYQGDQVVAPTSFGDAVTGQIKSTVTVIPWGGGQLGPGASAYLPQQSEDVDSLEPRPSAAVFQDPRAAALGREVGIVGFHHPGRAEAWDKFCRGGFLSNAYEQDDELRLETPCEPGAKRPFRTAEAAFLALKFWSSAEEFSTLSSDAAVEMARQVRGQEAEDLTFAGFRSAWKGMLAVLSAKFEATSSLATALLKTGDAFLLERTYVVRGKGLDGRSCEGCNFVGLMLMLVRDRLSGESRWTEFIANLINLDTGKAHTASNMQQWQMAVRSATRALEDELDRNPVDPDPFEDELGEMLSIPRPKPTLGTLDGPPQDYSSQDFSQGDSQSEVPPSLLSSNGGKRLWASEF